MKIGSPSIPNFIRNRDTIELEFFAFLVKFDNDDWNW